MKCSFQSLPFFVLIWMRLSLYQYVHTHQYKYEKSAFLSPFVPVQMQHRLRFVRNELNFVK